MSNGPQGNAMPLVAIIGGMLVALYVATSILMDEGNQLAGLFFYMLLGSGVIGVLAPRLAFFMFILQSAYLDLFKRLMVIAGNVQFTDLFWVLGIAPVTVAGISTGLVMRMVFGKIQMDGSDVRRLVVAVLLNVCLAALTYVKGGGVGGTMREVANGSSYTLLLFIVPLIFSTPDAVARCTRFIIYTYVPVAIYGIYQQLFGFQAFEIDYLKTGLSIEVKLLESERVRAFSTLNSATSLSVIAASLAALTITLSMIGRRTLRPLIPTPVALGFVILFIAAWVASTVRVGILLLPVAIVGTYLFRKASTTRTFYASLTAAFIALVASASYLYSNIELWTRQILELTKSDAFASYMLNMNSYKDRLHGFMNVLANPKAYTPFGMSEAAAQDSTYHSHDPLSASLLNYGFVPVAIGLFIAGLALWRFHRVIFTMRDPTLQMFAAAFLANAAGNIAVSMVNGSLLGTFPVNVFFWVSLAFAASLRRTDARLAERRAQLSPSGNASPLHRDPLPTKRIPTPRFAPVARVQP
jgi:hypothetical protein